MERESSIIQCSTHYAGCQKYREHKVYSLVIEVSTPLQHMVHHSLLKMAGLLFYHRDMKGDWKDGVMRLLKCETAHKDGAVGVALVRISG